MAEIRMDTDGIRNLANRFQSSTDQIHTIIKSLSDQVNSSVGNYWVSPSAQRFQEEFQGFANRIRLDLNILEELRIRLEKEVSEYEASEQQY